MIKRELRTKQVTEAIFICSDGKEFTSEQLAQNHEKFLTGERKTCTRCNGKGEVNISPHTYVDHNINIGHIDVVTHGDKCSECRGKGYLEHVWK